MRRECQSHLKVGTPAFVHCESCGKKMKVEDPKHLEDKPWYCGGCVERAFAYGVPMLKLGPLQHIEIPCDADVAEPS